MKIVVLDAATLDFEEGPWSGIEKLGQLIRHDLTPCDDKVIVKRCEGAEVVLTNKVPISAATIDALPELKMVGVLATGFNVVDTAHARSKGISVCNVPAYSNESVAQHTVALMMEMCNGVGLHNNSVQAGGWKQSKKFSYWHHPVRQIKDMTVGFVGLGRIGTRAAEIVSGFACRILAHTRSRSTPLDYERFEWADRDQLFRESDIISLHCPMTDENEGFVNAELLKTMKPTAFLINTARGGLVNEADLKVALESGAIGGAALDVISAEPMTEDYPLFNVPNCVITPHIAWNSEPARLLLLDITADNIQGYLEGTPRNVVN